MSVRPDQLWELDRDISNHAACSKGQDSASLAQALDGAVLLVTTNGVLEDQCHSAPISKQKLNPWEMRKQLCKPSCWLGPLKTLWWGIFLLSLFFGKESKLQSFWVGWATFSSVLIIFQTLETLYYNGTHPGYWVEVLRLGLSGPSRKHWRKRDVPS